MSPVLRVLVLMDTIADADMLVHELTRTGFKISVRRVSTEAAYLAELKSPLDLILADNALQQLDAMRALQILRARELDIPLIVVTEAAGEHAAIECVRLGAADFVVKERPARLHSTIVRTLDQRALRAHARAADAALRQSAAINQAVLDSLTAHIAVLNADGVIVAVNEAWDRFACENGDPNLRHTGVGMNYLEVCHQTIGDSSAEASQVLQGIRAVLARTLDQFMLEYPCHSPTEERWFIMRVTPLAGEHTGAVVAHENITARTKAEAALRASEERFRTTFEQAAAGIAHIGLSGQFLRVNKRFCDIFGYSREELLKCTIRDFNAPDLVSLAQVGARRLLAGELPSYSTEMSFIRKNSAAVWINVIASLVCDDQDAPSYFIALIEDITERRKADTTRALLATIVDSSDDAIIGVALDGTVMSWNTGAEHLYGYRADQMINRPIASLRPPHLHDEVTELYDRLARGESTAHIETVRVRSDGRLIDVALTISAIINASGLSGFSTIAHDISARKQADYALRQTSAFVRLLQEVAVAANQATSLDHALQTAIDTICAHIGWPVGHVYRPDPAEPGALLPTNIWHLEDPQRFATFRAITEVVRLAPGIGLPGQVISSRKSVWVSDMILDVRTPRTQLIRNIGVRASFALPVLLGDEVAAVLEFFAIKAIEPDDALLDVLHHVGTQLGRVVERVRAEEALRAAEAQYRMLVEQIPAIIYTAAIDELSSTSYVSPQIEAILGFSPEEWIANPHLWFAQVHPDDRANMLETVGRAHISDVPIPTEYRSFTQDGSVVWLRDAARVVRDEAGQPLFMQGITLDITERKRAEEAQHASERLYRTLASNFPNGAVVLFDLDLRFTIADGAGLGAFGLTREQMEGRTIWDIPATPLGVESEAEYRAALAGAPHVREITFGDHAYVVHSLPVRDERGEIIAGMLMSQDITEHKRIEEALIDERALLARRVDERTADLSAANAELARAAMLKDEFLASMSHELRTPLNAVLGLSEALQEEVYGPITDRQRRSLQSIAESGRHLLELINDILDLAKIGAGKLELVLEPASAAVICQASLRMIKQIAYAKQLSVAVALDPAVTLVHVDARRVKQILVNLLSNAVKFTPEGGSIGLEMTGDPVRQAIDLTVWDTGIGIAQEQMSRLFQPFVQLDSRLARQYEGTGLGLALVYRMIELHGGSITVTSTAGQGSRFTVALPWNAVPGATDTPAHTPTEPAAAALARRATRHALVIEDSPTTGEQITRCLHDLAITSTLVDDGAAALALALTTPPDVIILDLLLAASSGWEVLARLKADPRTQAIPVVVISAIDARARGLALGAAEYLVKPVVRADLQRVLAPLVPPAGAIPLLWRSAATSARNISPPLVLLAEDNEATITMIADYLDTCGYQVVVARNGAEAITRAREVRPALVIMDIQMPGMDGLEATRRLRTIRDPNELPIIALTALAMPGDRERCLAAGANDYLSKPVSLHGLAALIAQHLQSHSSQQRSP